MVSSETSKGKEKAPEGQPRLPDYPVTVEGLVRWGDMDAMGHVNNAAYFTYFESARILYFDRIGLNESFKKTGVGPILASTRCDYVKAMTYPDQCVVGARVREVRTTSFTMDYAVFRGAEREVAAVGSGVVVLFDYKKNVKVAIPGELRQRIDALESGREVPGVGKR